VSDVAIWKPLEFNPKWLETNTSKLDNLLPSWRRKRKKLKEDSTEYDKFINRLKRQHAIETGVIERLYDLKQGVTETFIKEGFSNLYLQHGDANISHSQLMNYLRDHFDAIDFVFDLVKQDRPLSKSFILELHQLITTHQEFTEAVNSLGHFTHVSLLKGQFKQLDNNPKRDDGRIFLYCPPIQVESEVDRLLEIYNHLEESEVHPIVKAAWLHHAFVQIHPFQDGNGRMARLLASLILIKAELFPLTIERNEKKRYIASLESADRGNYQPIVDLFCDSQIRNIEFALNVKVDLMTGPFRQVVEQFGEKVRKLQVKEQQIREEKINQNRQEIALFTFNILERYVSDIQQQVGINGRILMTRSTPEKAHFFTHQIARYATQHQYFFNSGLPRAWYRIRFRLPQKKMYQLIISIHHFGYDDSAFAFGAFLEIAMDPRSAFDTEKGGARRRGNNGEVYTLVPLEIKPLTVSSDISAASLKDAIEAFLQETMAVALAQIVSEIK
jgi:fido (protein-threonine AMPylation protein)